MDRRRFVRHPIRVPIAVRPHDAAKDFRSFSGDISEGGISFESPAPLAQDTSVDVELPVQRSRFKLLGTVCSCVANGDGFRVGISFVQPDTVFKMKLAEQALRIAELQQTLSKERGVEVSSREAAQIWVEQYASTFADLYTGAR